MFHARIAHQMSRSLLHKLLCRWSVADACRMDTVSIDQSANQSTWSWRVHAWTRTAMHNCASTWLPTPRATWYVGILTYICELSTLDVIMISTLCTTPCVLTWQQRVCRSNIFITTGNANKAWWWIVYINFLECQSGKSGQILRCWAFEGPRGWARPWFWDLRLLLSHHDLTDTGSSCLFERIYWIL